MKNSKELVNLAQKIKPYLCPWYEPYKVYFNQPYSHPFRDGICVDSTSYSYEMITGTYKLESGTIKSIS